MYAYGIWVLLVDNQPPKRGKRVSEPAHIHRWRDE